MIVGTVQLIVDFILKNHVSQLLLFQFHSFKVDLGDLRYVVVDQCDYVARCKTLEKGLKSNENFLKNFFRIVDESVTKPVR